MVTNFRPRRSQSVVKTNIFLTRHAFHTLYMVLGDARRRKINSCLRVLLTSFVLFFERGFDNYLQHFVVMATGSSHLSLCFFARAVSAFWEGHPSIGLYDFHHFWSANRRRPTALYTLTPDRPLAATYVKRLQRSS